MKALAHVADVINTISIQVTFLNPHGHPMSQKRPSIAISFCVAAILATASSAFAWDKDSRTVRLPGQKVVIQTGDPSVTVRERVAARSAHFPLNTLFVPMQMPLIGVGVPLTSGTGSRGFDESISRALEAEHHTMMAASARAAFDAEVKHKQNLLKKLGTESKSESNASIEEAIVKINSRLDEMQKRLTAVEQLLVIHDNYIRKSLSAPVVPEAIGTGNRVSHSLTIGAHVLEVNLDKNANFIHDVSGLVASFDGHRLFVKKNEVLFNSKSQIVIPTPVPEPTAENKCRIVVTFVDNKLSVSLDGKKLLDAAPIKQ
jgi:hypothetical protein